MCDPGDFNSLFFGELLAACWLLPGLFGPLNVLLRACVSEEFRITKHAIRYNVNDVINWGMSVLYAIL